MATNCDALVQMVGVHTARHTNTDYLFVSRSSDCPKNAADTIRILQQRQSSLHSSLEHTSIFEAWSCICYMAAQRPAAQTIAYLGYKT